MNTGPATLPQIKSGAGSQSGNSFSQQVNDNEDNLMADRASVDPNNDQCVDMDQDYYTQSLFNLSTCFLLPHTSYSSLSSFALQYAATSTGGFFSSYAFLCAMASILPLYQENLLAFADFKKLQFYFLLDLQWS
jgi:hypothetical protein